MKHVKDTIRTVRDINPASEELNSFNHTYQKYLTQKLDGIQGYFDQEILNEIVLWKVNRYVQFNQQTTDVLNRIKTDDTSLDYALTGEVLILLLSTKGVRLPMASTILRFKNPNIYQIIDQRVYRVIYGKSLKLAPLTNLNAQIVQYIDYLQELRMVSEQFGIPFFKADRVLYELDKKYNENIKY